MRLSVLSPLAWIHVRVSESSDWSTAFHGSPGANTFEACVGRHINVSNKTPPLPYGGRIRREADVALMGSPPARAPRFSPDLRCRPVVAVLCDATQCLA